MELLQIIVLSALIILGALLVLAIILAFCTILVPIGIITWICYGLYLLGRWIIKWIRKS